MLETAIARNYARQLMPTFGANVKAVRERRGLTQKHTAEKAKMSQPQWNALENKRAGLPEGPTLLRVAKALECSVEDLLIGVDSTYDEIRAQHVTTPKGGMDAATEARLHDLEARVTEYEATLREVTDVAKRLTRIAAFGGKGRAPRGAESKGGGRDRKAG